MVPFDIYFVMSSGRVLHSRRLTQPALCSPLRVLYRKGADTKNFSQGKYLREGLRQALHGKSWPRPSECWLYFTEQIAVFKTLVYTQ